MLVNQLSENEKRKLIVETLDKSMFVEAGAGAGKTTLIISRIVNQLKSGILPRELVAITFTNAATHDLKDRIVTAARRESLREDISPAEKEQLTTAVNSIDQMQISTIHSFCNRILKERSLDANMPMDLSLIDEDELKRQREESFTVWAQGLTGADWRRLNPERKNRKQVIDLLKNITWQWMNLSSDMHMEIAVPVKTKDEFEGYAVQFLQEFTDVVTTAISRAHGLNFSSLQDISADLLTKYGRDFINKLYNTSLLEGLKFLLTRPATKGYMITNPSVDAVKKRYPSLTEKQRKEIRAQAEKDLLEILDFVESKTPKLMEMIGGYERMIYEPYLGLGQQAAAFCKERLGNGVLTNNLLLEKTYDLLKNSPESRKYFAEKFKCIYVDEYQDTDHIQDAFIRMLAEEEPEGELRKGALFVVGDPKQSIYRFRGAQPEVYFETKNRFADLNNAYVIELADNYRSNNLVIEWVNTQFQNKRITGDVPYKPMNIVNVLPNEIDDDIIAGIYYHNIPAEKPKSIREDILAVTKLIQGLKKQGYCIYDKDKNNQYYKRPIQYKDFLVLCMYTKHMEEYANAFRSYGIPVVMDSKSDINNLYCKAFVKLYHYVTEPYYYRYKVGAEEALCTLGIDSKYFDPILLKLKSATEGLEAAGSLRFLADNWRMLLPIDVKLEKSDISSVHTRITQMVEKVMLSAGSNSTAIAQALEDYLEKKVEHELIMNPKEDAIKFMNLHKAKGLEGNIVIWTNRQENTNFQIGKYTRGHVYYPELETWSGYKYDSRLTDEAMEQDVQEKIRLEYVAATRAKQAVIFMDDYSHEKGLFTKGYQLGNASIKETSNHLNLTKEESDPQQKTYKVTTKKTEPEAFVTNPLFLSQSPSDFEDESAGKSAEGQRIQGAMIRPYGNIFGTVMHRSFELLVNRMKASFDVLNTTPQNAISACYLQAIRENIEDIPVSEVESYKAFLHEALWAYGNWWKKAGFFECVETAYTELPFTYFQENSEKAAPQIWRHGSADLVLRMKDGRFLVIDYKSDNDERYPDEQSFEDRLKGKYSEQIKAYREAISRSFGVEESLIDAKIISFSQKGLEKGQKLRVRVTVID